VLGAGRGRGPGGHGGSGGVLGRGPPVAGAADRASDVLVWYSPSALHFGVRAQAATGGVQATLADRDRIDADDHVQFFLSTFGDGRQAFVFAVNPFSACRWRAPWWKACDPPAAGSAACA